ncbi:MAG: hypothetical protein WC679_13735 [Bacteroidales bacterium]|jgi:hypothetical protein
MKKCKHGTKLLKGEYCVQCEYKRLNGKELKIKSKEVGNMKLQIRNQSKDGADVIIDKWSYYVPLEYVNKIEQLIVKIRNIACQQCTSVSNLKIK